MRLSKFYCHRLHENTLECVYHSMNYANWHEADKIQTFSTVQRLTRINSIKKTEHCFDLEKSYRIEGLKNFFLVCHELIFIEHNGNFLHNRNQLSFFILRLHVLSNAYRNRQRNNSKCRNFWSSSVTNIQFWSWKWHLKYLMMKINYAQYTEDT